MLFRVFTVVAVIALAISTWILSSPARRPQAQTDTKEADLPGYYLKNAVLTDYDLAGDPNIRIEAERIDQIAHGNEVALYNVRVNYQAPGGQSWVMCGCRARPGPPGANPLPYCTPTP
jgi:LPS export ABC transporter protein LptC